jgi:hypothetical protein
VRRGAAHSTLLYAHFRLSARLTCTLPEGSEPRAHDLVGQIGGVNRMELVDLLPMLRVLRVLFPLGLVYRRLGLLLGRHCGKSRQQERERERERERRRVVVPRRPPVPALRTAVRGAVPPGGAEGACDDVADTAVCGRAPAGSASAAAERQPAAASKAQSRTPRPKYRPHTHPPADFLWI